MRTLLLLALLSSGCSAIPRWAQQPVPTAAVSDDELAVITALLNDPGVAQDWGAPQPVLLLDESEPSGASRSPMFLGPDGEYCPPEALLALLATASAVPARLPASGAYGPTLTLYSWRQFQEDYFSFSEEKYSVRYGYYVNVVSVSRPAISASGDQAVIGIHQVSPRTGCSLGYLAYLERHAGQWYVIATGDNVIS